MPRMFGLDAGVRLEEVVHVGSLPPEAMVEELGRLGLLDAVAVEFLKEALLLKPFGANGFTFHPVRCTAPPMTRNATSGKTPWKKVGNIFAWKVTGKLEGESLNTVSKDQHDHVWCEFCLAAND